MKFYLLLKRCYNFVWEVDSVQHLSLQEMELTTQVQIQDNIYVHLYKILCSKYIFKSIFNFFFIDYGVLML